MREELIEKAREYQETQNKYREVADELEELRRDTFGDESKDTEEKARELFADVGGTDEESSKTEEIDELREEKQHLENKLSEIRENLWELLVDIKFPLNEEIKTTNDKVTFPYSEPIPPEVIEGISEVLGDDFDNGNVSIGTEAIEIHTESVDEAIESVHQRVKNLRESAEGLLDVDSHVEDVYNRDSKVAGMLYVLNESAEDSLVKKEMEQKMGLESGDLRGQLYHVVKNDPYLTKNDQNILLTSIGENVIEEFVRRYGVPTIVSESSEESDDEDQEVVA